MNGLWFVLCYQMWPTYSSLWPKASNQIKGVTWKKLYKKRGCCLATTSNTITSSIKQMRFSLAVFAVAASLLISRSQALTAPTIAGCPGLKPRSAPATKANDLRPDDIKVVAALGDR